VEKAICRPRTFRIATDVVLMSYFLCPEHRSGKRSSSSKRSDDEAPDHAYVHVVFYPTHPYDNFSTIR